MYLSPGSPESLPRLLWPAKAAEASRASGIQQASTWTVEKRSWRGDTAALGLDEVHDASISTHLQNNKSTCNIVYIYFLIHTYVNSNVYFLDMSLKAYQ